jgi:hypothetical protein
MSVVPVERIPMAGKTRSRSSYLLAGPRFPILFLTALPAAVVALSSAGHDKQVSALIAVAWFSLVPVALFERWVALALPIVAATFLVLTLAALPFGSTAMTVDIWTSAAMLVLSLPVGPRVRTTPPNTSPRLIWEIERQASRPTGRPASAIRTPDDEKSMS